MSFALRLMLFVGSLFFTYYILLRIRKSRMQIEDSIFWILFSAVLIIVSVFPKLPQMAAQILGIQSPVNFVYLFIMFILLINQFAMTIKISHLETRQKQLIQQMALDNNKHRSNSGRK